MLLQTSLVGVELSLDSAIVLRDRIAVSLDGFIGVNVFDDLIVPLEVTSPWVQMESGFNLEVSSVLPWH